MAVSGGVCPAILPADRQLLLHAAQRREHSDRRWQIRHASCKALAAGDKEPAPNPWPLSNRPSHAYEGKPKSATLSLSPPRARESSIGKGLFLVASSAKAIHPRQTATQYRSDCLSQNWRERFVRKFQQRL